MSIKRLHILNKLVGRFDYRAYLEIGIAGGATFRHLAVDEKTGVDPRWRWWYLFDRRIKKTTSDRFFTRNRRSKNPLSFDLVFIDGLHVAEQAWRDICHSLEVLRPHGTIVVHDCMPMSKEQQMVPRVQTSWTGNVWRAFLKASQDPGLDTFILDTNRGCGVIRRGSPPATAPRPPADIDPLNEADLSWEKYAEKRHEWLRIYPAEEVMAVLEGPGKPLGREAETSPVNSPSDAPDARDRAPS